jgi:alginate O-acetyltransferase complex protein AlgI
MVFSSISFLFCFLPLALFAYLGVVYPWLEKRGDALLLSSRIGTFAANTALLMASLLFYFWGEQKRIYILLAVIALNYTAGLLLGPAPEKPYGPRHLQRIWIVGVAVTVNVAILFIFKYLNFLVDTLGGVGVHLAIPEVLLPLGISFFVFQAMSYTVDVYRGHARPARDLIAFACYITMFPQLVAGPIVRYVDVANQLSCRQIGFGQIASGVRRFIIGLAKKVLVANQMAICADQAFALSPSELTWGAAWMGTLAYTLQIYFDFSGYSDMAIGLGRMFGFEFLENFNYPYVARSVQDFWRRWHISLSTWFRDYLYIPLGGNRGSLAGTSFNLVAVFALCGIWHGASVNFLLWGLYHGGFLMAERLLRGRFSAPRILGHFYTLMVVMFGWVLFRAENWNQTLIFWKAMLGFGPAVNRGSEFWIWFGNDIRIALVFGLIFSLPILPWLSGKLLRRSNGVDLSPGYAWLRTAVLLMLLLACIPLLAAETYNPFIYFRF